MYHILILSLNSQQKNKENVSCAFILFHLIFHTQIFALFSLDYTNISLGSFIQNIQLAFLKKIAQLEASLVYPQLLYENFITNFARQWKTNLQKSLLLQSEVTSQNADMV